MVPRTLHRRSRVAESRPFCRTSPVRRRQAAGTATLARWERRKAPDFSGAFLVRPGCALLQSTHCGLIAFLENDLVSLTSPGRFRPGLCGSSATPWKILYFRIPSTSHTTGPRHACDKARFPRWRPVRRPRPHQCSPRLAPDNGRQPKYRPCIDMANENEAGCRPLASLADGGVFP